MLAPLAIGFQFPLVRDALQLFGSSPIAWRMGGAEDATIIFKKTTDGLHIADIKMVEGKWRLAGQSGYALIVTGSGSTMSEMS